MVGLDGAIEVGPRDLDDALVGQPEPLQHDGDRRRLVLERELDVRQHPAVVAVGDEQRAPLTGGRLGEAVAVDEPHPLLERIDAEAHPREVEERQRRQDLDLDPGRGAVGDEEVDGPLQDAGRAGDGVQDGVAGAVGRGGEELVGDAAVDGVEGRLGVVDRVEAVLRPGRDGRRVAGRPQPAPGGRDGRDGGRASRR